MGEYIDIGSVHTWYESSGHGEPLVLLHGGLSNNGSWAEQIPAFAEHFGVFAPERRGHGHTPDVKGPLSYEVMARDTIGFLETVVGGSAHLVGWSDGGTVGLLVASARPDLVRQLVSIGANFDASGYVPGVDQMIESWSPDGPEVASSRGAYEAVSPDGSEHWPVVFSKTVDMWLRDPFISVEQLGRTRARTLVVVGDDDICTLEHAAALYRAVPDAELAVIPRTSHLVPMEKPDLVNMLVLDFLRHEPAKTMMPVHRALKADPA
jgi:pimeloyl-ACP methyl ester carboxylesterase